MARGHVHAGCDALACLLLITHLSEKLLEGLRLDEELAHRLLQLAHVIQPRPRHHARADHVTT